MITFEKKLKGEDLFEDLNSENDPIFRKFERVDNQEVIEINEIYKRWIEKKDKIINGPGFEDEHCNLMYLAVGEGSFSARSIAEFTFGVQSCDSYFGIFLSRLINNSRDKKILLQLEQHLDDAGYIGYNNIKGIELFGNKENSGYLGHKMKSGKIILHGDAGYQVGSEMRGGEIIVYGECGWCLGAGMSGGRIIVHGGWGEGCLGNLISRGDVIVCGRQVIKRGKEK